MPKSASPALRSVIDRHFVKLGIARLIPCVDGVLLARKSLIMRGGVGPLVSGLFDAARAALAFMAHR
jgi:hypothetical protein